MPNKDKPQISYALTKVRETFFTVQEPPEEWDNDQAPEVGFGFTFAYDLPQDTFTIKTKLTYHYEEEVAFELLRLECDFDFFIQDLTSFIPEQNGESKLPEGFIAILMGVALGTLRGIIHVRAAGTFAGQFVLPVLSPIDIVKSAELQD
jgi:hypothetical protein